jgi:hypothetical protein
MQMDVAHLYGLPIAPAMPIEGLDQVNLQPE